MFPSRYFADRYFAPRYWARVSSAGVPALGPLVASLVSAVVGGRVFGDEASPAPGLPYAVVTDVSATTELDTDTGGLDEYEVQLALYATGRDAARALAWQAQAALDRASAALDAGALIYMRPEGPPILSLDPETDEQGRDIWQAILTVRGLVDR